MSTNYDVAVELYEEFKERLEKEKLPEWYIKNLLWSAAQEIGFNWRYRHSDIAGDTILSDLATAENNLNSLRMKYSQRLINVIKNYLAKNQ